MAGLGAGWGNAGMWLCTPWLQSPRCVPKAWLLLSQREPRAFGHEVLAGLSHQLLGGCLCPASLGVSCPSCAWTLILLSTLPRDPCPSPGLALAQCGAVLLSFDGTFSHSQYISPWRDIWEKCLLENIDTFSVTTARSFIIQLKILHHPEQKKKIDI